LEGTVVKTLRQTFVELLKDEELSALDLSGILAIREKEVFDHLEHISRSLGSRSRLVIKPAQCKKCGFRFRKRTRMSSPSRCPQCKGEFIERPRYSIA
jgi:hypothetical protein